jgi:threonine dehydrogenase-like Zn-dependent dehydrogenase
VSYHAVNNGLRALARPVTAAKCLVLGGGAIGLAAALVLAMHEAAAIHVAEPNAARRKTIQAAGNFEAYAPGTSSAPVDGSVHLVIDAVAAETTRAEACRIVRPGGVIVHIGLLPGSGGIDVRKLTLQKSRSSEFTATRW